MKRAFLLALTSLTALFAASCQKEDLGRILSATIEHYEQDAKVYVNTSHYACWNNGDSVSINGQSVRVSINNNDDEATLPIPQGMEESDLLAFYPARFFSNHSSTGGTLSLPQKQQFRRDANGNQVIDNPMAAFAPAGSTELRFCNLCALLKITLPARDSVIVRSITVKGVEGYPLCGIATLKLNEDNKPRLTVFKNGCDSVTLTGIDEELSTSKSYYIVVPAFATFVDITVSVSLEKDLVIYMNRKTKANFDHILERNHIGALTYGWNSVETIARSIIRYTTTDNSIVAPSSMGEYDNSEYGVLLFSQPVTSIADEAFNECNKLKTITLPESVTSIGDFAFSKCSNLTSIDLPSSLTSIGDFAFSKCSNLTSIDLPSSLTSIGSSAFSECSNLTSIDLPSSLTSIGDFAFNWCSSLSSIDLPSSLTSIGYSAFRGCSNLTSIDLPSSLTSIGSSAFNECSNLTSINWPAGVTSIKDNMFENCTSLSSVTLPNTLTLIDNFAFDGCTSLSSITLPASLTKIEYRAFVGCSALETVNVLRWGGTPAITEGGEGMFDNCSGSLKIYVPSGSSDTYKAADYWSNYSTKIE